MTRKTQKKLRKLLTLVSCAVLLVCVTVVGTVAYLTSKTEVVTNTFTVGNVSITLDETDVNVYGVAETPAARVTENTYKLIPGHSYIKDPIIHVAKGSEESWLFVKVTDEITGIQDDATIASQMSTKGWTAVDADEYPGVYAYNTKVDARTEAKNITVFENFKVKSDADVASYNNKTITVQAYAVQADGFNSSAAAWGAAPLAAWKTPVQG